MTDSKSVRRYVKKIWVIFLLITAFISVSGGIITIFFREEVIRFVIESLNQQVNSRIEVQSAHFSLFRKFPNASVEFRNVTISPVKGFDTLDFAPEYSRHLLVAEKVFIQLNFFSILTKDFRITQMDIQDGDIHILTDKNNRHNYLFWKTAREEKQTSTPVELENVLLSQVNVFYSHQRTGLVFSVYAEKARISGRFSTRQYSLEANVSGMVRQLSVGDDWFVREKTLELSGKLDVDDQTFSIRKAHLEVAEAKMSVSGGFMLADPVDLDLHLEGKQLEYSSFVSLLPDKYGTWLRPYPGKGNCYFSADITGVTGKGKKPHIEAEFGMEQASITHRESRNKLTELTFSGTFTTGDRNQRATSVLTIQHFGCRIGNGKLNGSLTVKDFRKPSFAIKLKGNMDMEQLTRFIPAKQLTSVKGWIDGDLSANMRWKGLSVRRKSDMEQLDVRGTIQLKQVSMNLNRYPYQLENANGTLTLGQHISAKNFSFVLNKNDFSFDGQVKQLFPYLLDKTKTIVLEGKVVSKNLDIVSLLPSETTNVTGKSSGRKNEDTFLLPDYINFNASLSAGTFRYRNFTATQLETALTYQPRSLGIKSIKFTSMSGHFSGNGVLANHSRDHLRLSGNLSFSDVDIRKAFQTFDHFSQEVLRAEHINGLLSGNFNCVVAWDGAMNLKQDEIQALGDLTLTGGALSHFDPATKLSRFIALEELQDIRFSTLKTQISVKNKQVSIPVTQIESSAFNISGSGEHYFDNQYTYRIKILLSELLAAKARKNKKENREHEYEEDGGKRTAIYLKLEGQDTDFKISYDKQSAKASVTADIKKEKQNLKSILHQEFGWFKKDTTIAEPAKTPVNTGKLRFSFEEEKKPEQEKPAKKAKQKKTTTEDEKIKIEWE